MSRQQQQQATDRLKPEEIAEWKQHPATRAFLYDLRERQQEGMEAWAAYEYQKDRADATALANARALGGMEILKSLVEFLEGKEG